MGTSGQSFGAFAVKGVLLELEGDSQEGLLGVSNIGDLPCFYPQEKARMRGKLTQTLGR